MNCFTVVRKELNNGRDNGIHDETEKLYANG